MSDDEGGAFEFYDSDYDFNNDGHLDKDERGIMWDDWDQDCSETFPGSGSNYKKVSHKSEPGDGFLAICGIVFFAALIYACTLGWLAVLFVIVVFALLSPLILWIRNKIRKRN